MDEIDRKWNRNRAIQDQEIEEAKAWIKAVGQLGVNLHHELNEMDGEELRELSDGELRIVRNFATIGWSLVIEKMVENQSQAPPTT